MAMRAWKTAAVGLAGGATLGLLMLDMVYWREPHRAAVIAAVEPGKPPPRPVPREDVPAAAPAGPVPTAIARPVWRQVPAGTNPQNDGATSGHQHADLVREIQSELTRVGCYDGAPNGVWDTPSRDAASELARHLNASIAPERPDHVLLALAENTEGRACRTVCDQTGGAGCRATAIMAGLPRRMPAVQATGSLKANADPVTSQATAAPEVKQ